MKDIKKYYKQTANAAVLRIKQYLLTHSSEPLPKKHNELFRMYFSMRNIDTGGKKLRDLAVIEFNTGQLDSYKPQKNPIVAVKKEKNKPQLRLKKRSVGKVVNNIYESQRWIDIKKVVYSLYDFKCMKCGTNEKEMHVDHICPVSKYPAMKWNIGNLQLLCKDCNMEKSNLNENDYRTLEQKEYCKQYLNGDI